MREYLLSYLIPVFVCKLDGRRASLDTRSVHEDMQLFLPRVFFQHAQRVRYDRLCLFFVGEIGVDDGRGAAGLADGVEGGGGRVLGPMDEDEVGACLGECERDCGADACNAASPSGWIDSRATFKRGEGRTACCASDQRDFARQREQAQRREVWRLV